MPKTPTFVGRSFVGRRDNHLCRVRLFKGGRPVRDNVPRQWLYATKPRFARLRRPLAHALERMDEVHLILDLRRFRPGNVRIQIKPDGYFITAIRGDMRFVEKIVLPHNVDMLMKEQRFKNGILELVLPKKTILPAPPQHQKGN